MNYCKIVKIFCTLSQANPNPVTELNYTNKFTLLIAIILSAQATDNSVNKVTKDLFKIVNSPKDILNLGYDKLKNFIKSIGLYNSKANNIIELSKILIEKYNCIIPTNLEELIKLPGVGRKTANVWLNIAFNIPTIAVDTHVFRVSNRIGLVNTKTPLETELKLIKIVPKNYLNIAHHLLILHGRYICKARKPLCYNCSIVQYCNYNHKNLTKDTNSIGN